MARSPEQRALDLIEASLDLPASERVAWLRQAGAADPELALQLARLESELTRAPGWPATDAGPADSQRRPTVPDRIGPFVLRRVVGRGGMGAVYEGERDDGLFQQRVALKLLTSRRWSAEMERRFAAERQILARLEHRNIARIYDGGVTADGQSFIVMEYIDGLPITEYAQRQRLDLRARVRLLGQLTGALQFAHQQLVVHADIKPSNVLVTTDGSVKLLDFGVAQLLDFGACSAPDTGASTGQRDPITAAYAAPERIAGGAPSVAGDVFSLGVVLRELLATSNGVAKITPDLRAIVDRATAADPLQRYGNIGSLWDDLVRWLNRFPVRAYPGRWRYRLGRFIARNRASCALGAIILVVLLTATAISLRLYANAEAARAAEAAQFEEVRSLSSFLVNDLSDQMANRPGMAVANWATLRDSLERLRRLARDRPNDARLQIEIGRNIARIGISALYAGKPNDVDFTPLRPEFAAVRQRLEALPSRARHLPGFWELQAELSMLEATAALNIDGDSEATLRYATAMHGYAEKALAQSPESIDALSSRIDAGYTRSSALNAAGRADEAIQALEQLLGDIDWPRSNETLAAKPRLAALRAEFMLCDLTRWWRTETEATRRCSDTIERHRNAMTTLGRTIQLETQYAYALFLLATAQPRPRGAAKALVMLDEAQQVYARILHFGDNAQLSGASLLVTSARAMLLADLGQFDLARATARELLEQRRTRLAAEPANHRRQREVATALRRVGEIELQAQQPIAACMAFAEAGGIWDRMQREGRLLAFDLAPQSGQVPWIRAQLARCAKRAI